VLHGRLGGDVGIWLILPAHQYAFMLLSVFPDKLRKVREEHDRVFDKDHEKTFEMLQQDMGRLKELEYTAAVISETLRFFPIGMVVRQPPTDW